MARIISVGLLGLMVLGMFVGCGKEEPDATSQSGDAKTIVVASKPFTENYIIAEMITLLLQNRTELDVRYLPIEGGTTSILHPALVKGEIDIYPEYTGTGWQEVLKRDTVDHAPADLYQLVKEAYAQEFDIVWLPALGFDDTFTLAVPAALAQEKKLQTFSDLAAISGELRFGAEPDFYERYDGYDGLVAAYGFQFKEARQMAIALKYNAIESNEVDVINAFSTDGMLQRFKMVVLKDDQNYFPSYLCAPVVRGETLRAFPEIADVLAELAGSIDEATMTQLNYQVDELKQEPGKVAEDFLRQRGLLQ